MTKVVLGGKDSVSWSKTDSKHFVESDLDDESLLVLDANDGKPTKSPIGDDIIHKTKHCDGILIAFVFRLVRTHSKFHPKTNNWMWEFKDDKLKDKVMKYIDNNKSKYDSMKNVNNKKAKNIMHENMNKCVLTLQFAISSHRN